MKKIISDIYDRKREVGIYRCGDNFDQNDSEVKTISVSKVFNTIVKYLWKIFYTKDFKNKR